MAEVKETKAQRIERLKREKNPWQCLAEIEQFACKGFDSIPPEWLGTYLRWWGIYTQGDGVGAVGGAGGEGKAVPYFMVRIRIPNGLLLSHQLRTVAALAERYARGVVDITVRQNIQLHWVTIEALPEVMRELWRAGLSSLGTCGDVTRNVTGCPLAGVDADEICDASPLALETTRLLNGNPAFYNLPRKYKVSISGCRVWCSYPEINDVGLTATRRSLRGHDEIGFTVRVGGGLSTDPHLGVRLDAFVRWEQVVPTVRAITEVFRDSEVLRQSRERARMKFLFLRHEWNAESFQGELERRLGFAFDPAAQEEPPLDVYRDHVGIHPQRQPGYCYVGVAVLRGRISTGQMQAAAELADRFAGGELRTTNMQNLLVVNVPQQNADTLALALEAVGLRAAASPFWRGAIACTGVEFCKLAITETKGFARWIVEEMDERMPGFDQQFKLHVTGCPNSCGQHWIADVGLEGKKVRLDGELQDAYYFCLGGSVGQLAGIARAIGYRCLASEVPDALERLLTCYIKGRQSDENLRQFFARHSDAELRSFLAGKEVAAAPRDPSPGRTPHGLEG